MKDYLILLLIGLGLITTGCTSISTLQDARTTAPGKFETTVALGNIGAKVTSDGSTGLNGDLNEEVTVPQMDVMLRYGLAESWDVGIRTSMTSHGLDTKFNFLDTGFIKLALGMGANYLNYEITTGSEAPESKAEYTTLDLYIPLYINFHMSENNLVYLVPKMLKRKVSTSDISIADATYDYVGGSLGLKLGVFFVEGTYLYRDNKVTNEKVEITQSAVGLTW